uniref:Mitochondrial import inner membrane translocase subunit TIM14 n=1 Tax=Amphiprion percula TaxID=161767 RepID=A0A3P8T6I8_AMPPE
MASSMVAVGLALAAAGFAGRYAMQAMKQMEPQVKQALQSFPKTAFGGGYYRGGFEPKMTKREAALVLGVSPTANKNKIREAHRKLMILNHPDRGKWTILKIPHCLNNVQIIFQIIFFVYKCENNNEIMPITWHHQVSCFVRPAS